MNPDNPECNHHHQNESTNHQLVLSAHNPHDYTQQLPCFTSRTQLSEVGSPTVSSTSNQETETGGMGGIKESSNSNIGSIITMLIDDQNVSIDDILTEEQYRQDCQETANQQPKIKEEVVHVTDYGDLYQDYSYGDNYRCSVSATTSTTWSGHNIGVPSVPNQSAQQPRPVNCLSPQSGVSRDDKYWERRRKNNLAAKKSRDTRRMRENQLRLRVLFLENANKVLREQMGRKEQESGKLRERLRLYENNENCHT